MLNILQTYRVNAIEDVSNLLFSGHVTCETPEKAEAQLMQWIQESNSERESEGGFTLKPHSILEKDWQTDDWTLVKYLSGAGQRLGA